MFGRKRKELEYKLSEKRLENADLRATIEMYARTVQQQREALAEYEKTEMASYDMNVLFAAVIDYGRVVARLYAPDPVKVQPEVRRVFNKYRVDLP
jgi:hypothetical protein